MSETSPPPSPPSTVASPGTTRPAPDFIGIVGVGHFAEFLVQGLIASGVAPDAILLSPRGAATAAALAARFGVRVAPDNATVVADSQAVVLAVRPPQAVEVAAPLPWRPGQLLLSICAGLPIAALQAAAPAARVVRAMPIGAVAQRRGPTPLYPDAPDAHALLARLGPVLPLASESALEIASVTASIYGWVHQLIGESADWLAAQGIAPETARQLVAGTFAAAGHTVAEEPDRPVAALVAALATPGGITERGLAELARSGLGPAWRHACDATLERLRRLAQGAAG